MKKKSSTMIVCRLMQFIAAIFVIFFLSACGEDSNTTGGPAKLSNADMEVESYSQLPSCAEKREGKTAYVADQDQGYICQGGEWIEDYGLVKAYGFSSEKSSSSGKNTNETDKPVQTVDPTEVKKGTMTDSRDAQIYKTVTIGMQTWMAENLNYKYMVNSFCYNDSEKSCDKYGRLYVWSTAKIACPNGWHLPTKVEFEALFIAVGGQSTANRILRSVDGWVYNKNGTDAYAFSALPAGYRDLYGNFSQEGCNTSFWSATEGDSNYVYRVFLGYEGEKADLYKDNKDNGFSVRCVKD